MKASFRTPYKNLRCGVPPEATVLKIWLWIKNSNKLNWAVWSEYKDD